MATKFDDIYKLYLQNNNDLDMKKYTTDYSYNILWTYLSYSISLFGDYCYKNINDDYIPFQRIPYEFVSDGIINSFILNPSPPLGCDFYVSVDSNETMDYSFNIVTNQITINSLIAYQSIYVGAYIIGEFNNTLNVQEQNILASGMSIPFKKNKLNSTLLLNMLVHSKDFNSPSQANHIKEVRATVELEEKTLQQRIKMYMWKQKSIIQRNLLHG